MKRFALALFLLGTSISAQEAPAPTFSPDEQIMVQTLMSLRTVMGKACLELEVAKQYNENVQKVAARVAANHPGYVLSQTLTLMPKPAEKK